MIRVVVFASVREAVGESVVELGADNLVTVLDVVQALARRGPAWKTALAAENLLYAVNQTMAGGQHPVRDGDEVALFPPVTGG